MKQTPQTPEALLREKDNRVGRRVLVAHLMIYLAALSVVYGPKIYRKWRASPPASVTLPSTSR
jgi:hypothetical protein